MVVDVQVQGHDSVPLSRISPLIRTRPGRPLESRVVEDDVRRMVRSRQFVDVRPRYQQVPEGVVVIFQVIERRTIKYVKYLGRKQVRRDKPLADKTGLKVGDSLDPFAVEEGRRKLEEFYGERGHARVRVTVLEGDQPEDRGVVYLIHEGPKQRVSSIDFVGAQVVSGARLKTQIQTRKPILGLFKGFVDRQKIDDDVQRLIAYYRSLGYFQARIGRELEWDDDLDRLALTFVIDEGPRFRVRDVRFMGNTKFSTEDLAEKLKLKSGQFFDQNQMDLDVNAIQDTYGGTGYIFTNIIAEPRFLEEPGELDLVYRLEEGARYRIGRINVHIGGENPHTRHTAVLNRLSLYPGDIADIRELRASERRLKASSIFLNNPVQGSPPRIVFTEPGQQEDDPETQVAERRGGDVRGQSPDEPGAHRVHRPLAAPEPAGSSERWIDLTVVDEAALLRSAASQSTTPPPPHSPAAGAPAAGVPEGGRPAPVAGGSAPLARGQSPGAWWAPLTRPLQSLEDSFWRIRQSLWASDEPTEPAPSAEPPVAQPAPSAVSGSPHDWSQTPLVVRGQQGWTPPGGLSMPQPARQPVPAASQPVRIPVAAAPPAAGQLVPVAAQQRAPAPSGAAAPQPYAPLSPYGAAPSGGIPPAAAPAPYGAPGSVAGGGAVTGNSLPAPSSPYAPPAVPGVGGYDSPGELFPDGGYFDPNEEPTQTVPVDVYVEETQTGRIMLGAGVNSNAGLVGNLIIDEQNFDITRLPRSWNDLRNGAFRGAGQQFRLEAVPGTIFQRYSVIFRDPYLMNTPISFGVSGSFFTRQYRDWFEERLGGQVSLGYQIRPDLTGTIALRGENVNVSNPSTPTPIELTEVLGNNGLYTVRGSLIQDTRDSAFLPTEGHRIELAYEQAFGEFHYPRFDVDLRKHFLTRQRADGSGRHVLTLASNLNVAASDMPIFENNFAGGFSTIRGYQFRGASPRSMGVIVGGRFMFLASAEYMFPITADDMLRGVVFCDTGTVETDVQISSENYRVAPGFGLRITIPALGPAPIALDFAFPVLNAPGDDVQNFSFFVGFNR